MNIMTAIITLTSTKRRLLHTEAFTHRGFYTQKLLPQTLLHTPVHTDAFTQTLLHTNTFTHTLLHTKTLHTDAFTHRPFGTQIFSNTEAFTHRLLYTQTDTLTHRRFYTQALQHKDTFTHRRFYTQRRLTLLHRLFYRNKSVAIDDSKSHFFLTVFDVQRPFLRKGCDGRFKVAIFP